MSRRWVWWTVGGMLVVLLPLAGWRVSLEIPGRMRRAEKEMVEAAARYGLEVRYRSLKFHPLHLRLSLDDLVVRDGLDGLPLVRAGSVDVSLSFTRLLGGNIPVSRIRVRDFRIEAGEANRLLYEKLTAAEGGGGRSEPLPEILLVDGVARLGPLGPVRRMETSVRELRIREVRFLGTRITASLARTTGDIVLPGGGAGAWPFASMDADLLYRKKTLRFRRLRAWGDAAAVRFSGVVDTGTRIVGGKVSGEVDIARWLAANAPGASFAKGFLRTGKVEFSSSVSGPWNNPEGSGKIVLSKAGIAEGPPVDGEAETSFGGRIVRVDGARTTLWGGTLEASGSYAFDSGRVEGKASLRRLSLAAVPWKSLGVPARFGGTGDASACLEGTPARLQGSLSLSFQNGVEQLPSSDRDRLRLRFPVTAEVSGDLSGRGTVHVDSFRLLAGKAEIRASGEGSLPDRNVRFRGSVHLPAGSAADYGWNYPLSWEKIGSEWEISGPVSRLRTAASLTADSVAARALPPLPILLKIDGDLAGSLHFVADVPAPSLKVRAVGTVAGLLQPSGARADLTVTAREIDLSESGRLVSAVASSLGEEPAKIRGYLEGVEGMAEADARIHADTKSLGLSGTVHAAGMGIRGVRLAFVEAEGEYGGEWGGARWNVRGSGRFGDGTVRVSARGAPGEGAEVAGEVDRLEIAQALSLLKRENLSGIRGSLDAKFAAKEGSRGWEVPRFAAGAKEITAGAVRVAGVRAEGSLGSAGGTFSVTADAPHLDLSAEIRRGAGWPTKVSLSATGLPTSFLLAAAGRPEIPSGGSWSGEADGVLLLGDIADGKRFEPDMFPAFRASVRGRGASVEEIRFQEIQASGRRQGDTLAGEILTRSPETKLAWSVSLREPFAFRVEGPFSLGEAVDGAPKDEKRRFSIQGRAEIQGALTAVGRTTGTVRIGSLSLGEGGLELTGKDLSARMDPDGVRWTGGTLLGAGNPVQVAGKISWKGDMDLRVEGKLPAGTVRLVVPGVFDRLDGTMALEVRVTGKVDDPSIVGKGHLEGGNLSFLGYAQRFEGMKVDAVISREKIVFEHFEGRSGGGYIDGWGEVPLKVDAGQRLYFSVDFLDMRYPYPEELRPVIQGHAELFGPVDNLLVTGDVEVQSAKYTKSFRPEKVLGDFGKRLADVTARREKPEFRVRLDIEAIADGTIRIRNNLANATAKGEFKVVGDSSRVIVLGSFDVTEGVVEFRGNKYELKRATVDFQDPRRNNPQIDARAETTKGNVTVTVTVTGTLDKYEVDFFSDPPMGKNDIVALLSLGVTTQGLAGQEGTVGSAAAASLALAPYTGGVEEGIRNAVGLDRFSIEPGFSSTTKTFEPRFIVGKSFGDRASVSVATSVGTAADSSATAEVKLREHIFLQGDWQSTTTTQEGDLGADLKFRYRYRQWKDFLRGKE